VTRSNQWNWIEQNQPASDRLLSPNLKEKSSKSHVSVGESSQETDGRPEGHMNELSVLGVASINSELSFT
jgi:hypothetical protein